MSYLLMDAAMKGVISREDTLRLMGMWEGELTPDEAREMMVVTDWPTGLSHPTSYSELVGAGATVRAGAEMEKMSSIDWEAVRVRGEAMKWEERLRGELKNFGCNHNAGWDGGNIYHDLHWTPDPGKDAILLKDDGVQGAWKATLVWHFAICAKLTKEAAAKKLAELVFKQEDNYGHLVKEEPKAPKTWQGYPKGYTKASSPPPLSWGDYSTSFAFATSTSRGVGD